MGQEELRCGYYPSNKEMKSQLLSQLFTMTVLLTGCGSIWQATSTDFPSVRHALASPNGMSVVSNADADTPEEESSLGNNHALFVESVRTGQRKIIYPYGRHVTVKWSPNGQHLAISDFDGSSHATCQIFSVTDEKLIDVEAVIMSEFGPHYRELAASHLYFTASSWISDRLLKVSATGYGLPADRLVTRSYIYDLLTGKVSSQ